MSYKLRDLPLAILILVVIVGFCLPAQATFPGQNGQITFVHFTPDGDEHVFVANPDGSNEHQLLAITSEGSDWSADGSRIAFDFFDGTTAQIGTINPDGSGFVQLTFDSAFHASPTWSPDGKSIAFDLESDSVHGIQIIDASDGTVLLQVTSNPDGVDVEPQWSPDGKWIVFSRATGNRPATGRVSPPVGVAVQCCFWYGQGQCNVSRFSRVGQGEERDWVKRRCSPINYRNRVREDRQIGLIAFRGAFRICK